MTPFMQQVHDALGDPSAAPEAVTTRSALRPLGEGLHKQVELRALAEQLVSEGNVVLRERGLLLTLEDEASDDRLAFVISCGHSRALIVAEVVGRSCAAFVTTGGVSQGRREIPGPEALAGLLLGLVVSECPAPVEK